MAANGVPRYRITPYERQQIQEALAFQPAPKDQPKRTPKERGCSLESARHEREMVEAAYAEAARRRQG